MNRARLRDLGVKIGKYPTGNYNAITDVPGVLVGQITVLHDQPSVARTGITVILPRENIGSDNVFGGFHRLNGSGEMTGIHWLEEVGLISSAIAFTNTLQIGMVRDALTYYSFTQTKTGPFYLPIAGETYDGWLNDLSYPSLTQELVFEALSNARNGPVDEGNVGGGTGMIAYEFKGGIGTSSRMVEIGTSRYTVGALVQANHGDRDQLRINGDPIGREITYDLVPSPWGSPNQPGSILVVLATDAPLISNQCTRLAQRATLGLARTGAVAQNSSGDLFLAFSTAHHLPLSAPREFEIGKMLPNSLMDPLFEATAEVVEEAILNALVAAETMTGVSGHLAYALPLDLLKSRLTT